MFGPFVLAPLPGVDKGLLAAAAALVAARVGAGLEVDGVDVAPQAELSSEPER